MESSMVGLLAETSIHPGSGQNEGAIDLPVARESSTGIPYIAGSSFKGALKDHARQQLLSASEGDIETLHPKVQAIFGTEEDGAGDLLPSDVRLLLLPVRSLHGTYKWLCCPYLLERLIRDRQRIEMPINLTIPTVDESSVLTEGTGQVFLEEFNFAARPLPTEYAEAIRPLIAHDSVKARLPHQLAILSDRNFSWYARYGLPVQARNVLNDKKVSMNLWYEETLPPDTLMYTIFSERKSGTVREIKNLFTTKRYIQAGGNETVGQGWFISSWLEVQRA